MLKLLWVDDDAGGTLNPLDRLLKRGGPFEIDIASDYVTATYQLGQRQYAAVLLDAILPPGEGGQTLSLDLGIKLAQKAAMSGIPSIAFLTVVRYSELKDEYEKLKSQFPAVQWSYLDKLSLMDNGAIETLIKRLKMEKEPPV